MISASVVKELREKTGCGMMDCKKALTECDGDMQKAVDFLREKGLATAEKKSSRLASEGLVGAVVEGNIGAMVEINSETDFVAKNEDFQKLVADVLHQIVETNPADLNALLESKFVDGDASVKDMVVEKVATIGENINVRRFVRYEGNIVSYVHGGGRIGVLVKVEADADNQDAKEAAKDIAMQIAAINPLYKDKDSVPAEDIEREKGFIVAQIKEDPRNASKPEQVLEKIAMGKIGKFYETNCLLQQAFVKDDSVKVEAYLASKNVKLLDYSRFEKGEGLQKKDEDFAAEVASMIK